MCELFGISSLEKIACNDLLWKFFAHSVEHPDGWGLAVFNGTGVSIEKEPVAAMESVYLKYRMTDEIVEDVLLAHIRKASVGELSYQNSHPFAQRDNWGCLWTLIHNGTIFESAELVPYKACQRGSTDSEQILCYLVDRINKRQLKKGRSLSAGERFQEIDEIIRVITPGNKVNLLIYDEELFYVHTNHRESLHLCERPGTLIVSTKPLTEEPWREVPLNTLQAYRRGELVYTGSSHTNEYIKKEDTENLS